MNARNAGAGRALHGAWAVAASLVPGMVACLLLSVGSAHAADPDASVINPLLKNPQAIEAGREIYARRCILCHGNQGGRGPDLFQNKLSDADFLATVLGGRTGSRGQMPAWAGTLTETEVWQVEAFVKSTASFNKE